MTRLPYLASIAFIFVEIFTQRCHFTDTTHKSATLNSVVWRAISEEGAATINEWHLEQGTTRQRVDFHKQASKVKAGDTLYLVRTQVGSLGKTPAEATDKEAAARDAEAAERLALAQTPPVQTSPAQTPPAQKKGPKGNTATKTNTAVTDGAKR